MKPQIQMMYGCISLFEKKINQPTKNKPDWDPKSPLHTATYGQKLNRTPLKGYSTDLIMSLHKDGALKKEWSKLMEQSSGVYVVPPKCWVLNFS